VLVPRQALQIAERSDLADQNVFLGVLALRYAARVALTLQPYKSTCAGVRYVSSAGWPASEAAAPDAEASDAAPDAEASDAASISRGVTPH